MCGLVAHLVVVANCSITCFLEAQFQVPLKLEFFFQASFLQLLKLQPTYKQHLFTEIWSTSEQTYMSYWFILLKLLMDVVMMALHHAIIK